MWSFLAIEALVRALMKLEGSAGGSHVLRVSPGGSVSGANASGETESGVRSITSLPLSAPR